MTKKKCEGIDCAWCANIECPNEDETEMTDKKHINDSLKNSDKNFNENFTHDKEQIIIDGVNVKDCRRRIGKNSYCRYFKRLCSDNNVNCVWKQLARKTQECENLKAEEKYLKQCCQKAGEELAKHSFDYDGKEKNLVVQAMELNEKYEKLEKALDEIEEYVKSQFDGFGSDVYAMNKVAINKILDIINQAK